MRTLYENVELQRNGTSIQGTSDISRSPNDERGLGKRHCEDKRSRVKKESSG